MIRERVDAVRGCRIPTSGCGRVLGVRLPEATKPVVDAAAPACGPFRDNGDTAAGGCVIQRAVAMPSAGDEAAGPSFSCSLHSLAAVVSTLGRCVLSRSRKTALH